MLRDEVAVQFPPIFRSNSATAEKDPQRCLSNRHAEGWGLNDLNAAHNEDGVLNSSGVNIPRKAIVVCPERISRSWCRWQGVSG